MPAMAKSHFPEATDGMMASKAISSTFSSMPNFSAMAPAISGSMPTMASPSWNSQGSNSALVAIRMVPPAAASSPAFVSSAGLSAPLASSFAAVVSVFVSAAVVSAFSPPPHAVRAAAMAAARITAVAFFIIFIIFPSLSASSFCLKFHFEYLFIFLY